VVQIVVGDFVAVARDFVVVLRLVDFLTLLSVVGVLEELMQGKRGNAFLGENLLLTVEQLE
jgi:hypothetical protein